MQELSHTVGILVLIVFSFAQSGTAQDDRTHPDDPGHRSAVETPTVYVPAVHTQAVHTRAAAIPHVPAEIPSEGTDEPVRVGARLSGLVTMASGGLGVELGLDLSGDLLRGGVFAGFASSPSLFDSRSEARFGIEMVRAFPIADGFRSAGSLGVGFSAVELEVGDDFWEETVVVHESRLFARVGASIEVGPPEGVMLQLGLRAVLSHSLGGDEAEDPAPMLEADVEMHMGVHLGF